MKPSAHAPFHSPRSLHWLALLSLLAFGLTACQSMEAEVQPSEPIEEIEPTPTPATTMEADPLDEIDLASAPAIVADPAPPPPPPPLPSEMARPSPDNECPPKCELDVTLPTNARMSPTISKSVMHARGGSTVSINLDNQTSRGARGATVLRFQEAAFVDRNGRPMTTVTLNPGTNVFTVRDYADGVCRAEKGGCKYDVINTGDPSRPVLDPHVIIWD